jgi:hypothetical protein
MTPLRHEHEIIYKAVPVSIGESLKSLVDEMAIKKVMDYRSPRFTMCHRWLQLCEAFYFLFIIIRGGVSGACAVFIINARGALDLPALRGHQIHAVRAASRYVHKNEVLSLLLIWDSSHERCVAAPLPHSE